MCFLISVYSHRSALCFSVSLLIELLITNWILLCSFSENKYDDGDLCLRIIWHCVVQVYLWWKNDSRRIAYQSTLYVTAKSIAVPSAVNPAMRSMHAVQEVGCLFVSYDVWLSVWLSDHVTLLSSYLVLKLGNWDNLHVSFELTFH